MKIEKEKLYAVGGFQSVSIITRDYLTMQFKKNQNTKKNKHTK